MLENTVCSLQSYVNNSKKFARAKMARARVEQKDDRKKESWLLPRETSVLRRSRSQEAVQITWSHSLFTSILSSLAVTPLKNARGQGWWSP